MGLGCLRELFEIPEEIAYLNCAYMAPLSRAVREAGEAGIRRKSRPWRIRAEDFFVEVERARALFARLIGGDADGVALVPAASYGIAVAAANLAVRPGQRIVVLAEQFPSNVYAWRALARRSGATVETVPRPADDDWTAALLAGIDERTAVVAAPHCHWTDGGLLDLRRVGARARAVGAALVVDATQSLGALPLDVGQVRPDFLTAATYKWLLGPYSMGFLYVDPRHREGLPIELGWCNRSGSEDFTGLVAYTEEFQPGARRFDVGERANFALLPMVIAALEQILAWGVGEIATTAEALTSAVEREARALGLGATPAARRAGHMVGLRLHADVAPDLQARLAAAQVYVSARGASLRVSPHVYNHAGDVARLVDVLRGAV